MQFIASNLAAYIFSNLQQTIYDDFAWPAGSGSIDPDELRTVLKSCLRESAISLPEEKLDDLTLALFESADKDNSGSITFEELKAELENFPEVMENLTIRSQGTANMFKHGASFPDTDEAQPWTKKFRNMLTFCQGIRLRMYQTCKI